MIPTRGPARRVKITRHIPYSFRLDNHSLKTILGEPVASAAAGLATFTTGHGIRALEPGVWVGTPTRFTQAIASQT
jgi:hypothetical protein